MPKRKLEKTIHTTLSRDDDYTAYLQLDALLGAQKPLSDPPHHDEMLFIIQHQVAELWMKLLLHELDRATYWIRQDALPPALKNLGRARQVQSQLYNQWKVLDTLTPSEYVEFRHVFGKASGFQSAQYRLLEFILGNKSSSVLAVYKHQPEWHARLVEVLEAPSLYDVVLRKLHGDGFDIDADKLERDFSQPYEANDSVQAAWQAIYRDPDTYFELYELAEKLVDIEDAFQAWRFKHMYTVQRIIGNRPGTGGSSGVPFLKKAIETSFFPELFAIRTEL